jgi:hypothetical protein
VATNSPAVYPTWLTPNSAWPLFIGAGNNDQSTPANYWSGLINEVAIYGSVLTPLQVQQHYAIAALGGYAPPTISQSPTNLQRYATLTASLTAQATSFLPSMTYQWMAGTTNSGVYTNLLNAGNISGVTTTNLVITNLSAANVADYVFVAQNAAGSVTSSVATLKVQPVPSDAYGAAVVGDKPVAFWRLNDTTATAYDYAGGYNGTHNSTKNTNYKQGQTGAGGYTANVSTWFDGASGGHCVAVPWSAALNPYLVTVECWVAPATLPTGTQTRKVVIGGIADTNNNSLINTGYYLELECNSTASSDRWGWAMGSGQSGNGGANVTGSAGNLVASAWYHLVASYDGTTETIYTNGVKASSRVVPYIPNIYPNVGTIPYNGGVGNYETLYPYTSLGIGAQMNSTGGGAGFNGNISDAAVYNYPLSAYQVLNQYTVAKTGAGVAAPVFTLQPQSVTTNAGSTVSLVGQATFAQPLTYQWMVLSNGVYINLVNGGSISGATTNTLVITRAAWANATNYVLVASYPGISVTSSAAALTLTAPPPISLTSAYVGGALTLNWTNSAYELMQATNVTGPWGQGNRMTNLSPYQVSPTNTRMFYRLVAP